MIQSDIIDSYMDIKKAANTLLNFTIKRIAETFGLIIFLSGILLFISLLTYSPNDPNFIFPDNKNINNMLGFRGSFVSDLFLQSIGLVSYLISFTLIISGINIMKYKELFLILENIFFAIIYSFFCTLFLTYFYSNDFTLYINGNGGFVGSYLNETFLNSIIQFNEMIFYYALIALVLFLFFVSINFHPIKFYKVTKSFFSIFIKRENKNYTDKSEVINEYIPQEEIKNLIQEDLPFIKAENKVDNKIKFKLPSLELLRLPTKKENGTRLRMRGKGEPSAQINGQNGDLFIELEIEQHPWFERSNADLIMSLPVGYSDLILGTQVTLPHIDGEELKIKIPPMTNSGETIEIRKRGLPRSRGSGRGDVVVLVKLFMPRKVSKDVKKKLDEIQGNISPEDIISSIKDDAKDRRN